MQMTTGAREKSRPIHDERLKTALDGKEHDIVTVLFDATVLPAGRRSLEAFTPGALPLAYASYEGHEIVTNDRNRAKAFAAQVAKTLYDGGRQGSGSARADAMGIRTRRHRILDAEDLGELDLAPGVDLVSAEVIEAPAMAAIPEKSTPALVYLHFRCRRDGDGGHTATKRFIKDWCRRRGTYAAGDAADRNAPGREQLAYRLSTTCPAFHGIIFAMIEPLETRHLDEFSIPFDAPGKAALACAYLDAGIIRRPYTITCFTRGAEPDPERPEDDPAVLLEARDWVSGQLEDERHVSDAQLRREAKHRIDLSADWFAYVGRDGCSFSLSPSCFTPAAPEQTPFGPMGLVYAHTIYADGFAYVLLGARLADQLSTTIGRLIWEDTLTLRAANLMNSSLLALANAYVVEKATSAKKHQDLICALRTSYDTQGLLEAQRPLVRTMLEVADCRQRISEDANTAALRGLLKIAFYGAIPAAAADKIQAAVFGDLTGWLSLLVWVAITAGVALLLWLVVRAGQARFKAERKVSQYWTTRTGHDLMTGSALDASNREELQ